MNSPKESVLMLSFFSSGFKSPGGRAIYRRKARVIKMQNVTLLDWPMNINCELHAAKEFREWQTAFIKH